MKNTFLPTKNLLNEKTWYLIDAENKTLGRVATQISQILMGKHKYDYSYHLDTAISSAVSPSLFLILRSAPLSINNIAISVCP